MDRSNHPPLNTCGDRESGLRSLRRRDHRLERPEAILVDLALVLLFGLSYSVMPRPAFKEMLPRLKIMQGLDLIEKVELFRRI
jgi:hypothetical protein